MDPDLCHTPRLLDFMGGIGFGGKKLEFIERMGGMSERFSRNESKELELCDNMYAGSELKCCRNDSSFATNLFLEWLEALLSLQQKRAGVGTTHSNPYWTP